jgi:hypothetical protein
VLIDLQKLEFLSLHPLPLELLSVMMGRLGRVKMSSWVRVLMVGVMLGLCAIIQLEGLLLRMRVCVVLMDMGEGVL